MTLEQLERKYGPLTYREKASHFVDAGGRIRRINHTRANGDFMDEMEAGLMFDSIHDDYTLTPDELEQKYGPLTLNECDYYVRTISDDEIYKKAGLKSPDGFGVRATWTVTLAGKTYDV